MTIHDFRERLEFSHQQADATWWATVYREAFGPIAAAVNVCQDGWAQRAGIDRVLTLPSGRIVKVDEKVREKDYDDILLERWSDQRRQTPGWVQKDLDCDYIAYAFVPSARCYLLPFLDLRRAWRRFGPDWLVRYQTVQAQNKGWVTESVAVPIPVLLDAIRNALVIHWAA